MKKMVKWIMLLLCVIVVISPVLAQVSPRFDLSWNVLSGGGGVRSSAHYQIDDALGQWPDGLSGSSNYQIAPGFWHVGRVEETTHVYLPLVQRE